MLASISLYLPLDTATFLPVMSKKYLSTPPFVTTEHEIDRDDLSTLQVNVASSVACSADGQTVYLADSTGLRKSEDGGHSWETLIDNS